MSRIERQEKQSTGRSFLKGVGAAGIGLLAGPALLGKSGSAMREIIPPKNLQRVLTTSSSEGLLNVHVGDGKIVRVSSLLYPELEASPMALNWDRRVYATASKRNEPSAE